MRYALALLVAATLLAAGCASTARPQPHPTLLESIPCIDWQNGVQAADTPEGAEITLDHEWMKEWLKDPHLNNNK
ncbi:MAG: hypothetical protein KF696_15230 [Planctomycetes bacterium]|nr:hypothetical protein [Planctomycetota bacterium]MCW8136024.1 hypothetical protein [Planctomycetota bacterium]